MVINDIAKPVGGEVVGLLVVKVGGGAGLLSSLSGLELECCDDPDE